MELMGILNLIYTYQMKINENQEIQSYNPFSPYSSISTLRPALGLQKKNKTINTTYELQQHAPDLGKLNIQLTDNISFWDQYFSQQNTKNTQLKNKLSILNESIALHRQSLKLKNQQLINLENAMNVSDEKVKGLKELIKEGEKKQKFLAENCHSVKKRVEEIKSNIKSQQTILLEEENHCNEIYDKMCKTQQYIKNSYSELDKKEELYERYLSAVEENKQLKGKVHHLGNNIALIQHQQSKTQKEDQILKGKLDELAKIAQMRQNKNKSLSKRLIQLKRFHPKNNRLPKQSFQQLKDTIYRLENTYSKLHDELFSLNDGIEKLNQSVANKSYQISKLQKPIKIQENQSPMVFSKKGDKSPQMAQGYKVIESDDDEKPTILKQQLKNKQEKEQNKFPNNTINLQLLRREQEPNDLQISQSVKELIDRYERVTSRQKKIQFL